MGLRQSMTVMFALLATMLGASAASASANTIRFATQLSPGSNAGAGSLSMVGEGVSAFSARLQALTCATGAAEGSDGSFDVQITPSDAVRLSGGRFQFTGQATTDGYGTGTAARPYGGDFTISARVNPDHTLVTATITLSDAQSATTSGCAGTYSLVAVPFVNSRAFPPDKAAYQSQFIHFDYAAVAIRHLYVQANFDCGGSEDAADVNIAAYGYPVIPTKAGNFRFSSYVIDEYQDIVSVTISGKIDGQKARGHISVSEPPGGFGLGGGGSCQGTRSWLADKLLPPAPPGPAAFFQWQPFRVAFGATWRYYFVARDISCTDHATEILVTTAGHTRTISCSRTAAFASGPLAPSRTYVSTTQAVETHGARIVKRGTPLTVPLTMPGPADSWTPVSGLPGTPPN
jgi:hypothetical protein